MVDPHALLKLLLDRLISWNVPKTLVVTGWFKCLLVRQITVQCRPIDSADR